MAVALAWIICPIVFGVCFIIHTSYFLYKILKSRSQNTSGSGLHITDGEAAWCMGWAWTSCVDKTTKTMTLNVFIVWYLVVLAIDVLFTVISYVLLYLFTHIIF